MAESKADRKKRAEAEEMPEPVKPLPYPKSVFFIIGNEFCERFSYYGMKTILSIYLKKKLHFSEDKATVIYHTFSMFCYFTPIFGAMLADLLLGKFKTIVYISVVYVLGHLLKTLAAIPTLGVPPVEFSLIGLALIAVGTGGIKPCVSSFGGDQFKLPEQDRQLQTFFSVFYFSINAGSLISTILTPAIREDVECFGDDTCYSLAFGIPSILMFVATCIIILGRPLYVMKPPQGNILPKVFGSIMYGIRKKGGSADHWLDTAKKRYDSNLVEDVKGLLKVLVIFLPLPVFWALFDQTGSRWTFQATRMNGQVGSLNIKPDQMQVINPVLILFLIPIFDRIIYPLFARAGLLKKPLQRMSVGGVLTASSFFISGILEHEMMKTYAKMPLEGEAHLSLINSLPCNLTTQIYNAARPVPEAILLPGGQLSVLDSLYPVSSLVEFTSAPDCGRFNLSAKVEVELSEMAVSAVLLSLSDSGALVATTLEKHDEPEKDDSAYGKLRILHEVENGEGEREVMFLGPKQVNLTLEEGEGYRQSNYTTLPRGEYELYLGETALGKIFIDQGGVYTLLLNKANGSAGLKLQQFTLTQPNTINILWLVPQYFVITIGEIMFSVTGLEFSYSQAPDSMKAVVQAAWLLTVAFGNIIVIIVAEAKSFNNQMEEFFFFGCLMIADMIIFIFLAYRYVPKVKRDEDEEVAEDMNMEKIESSYSADSSTRTIASSYSADSEAAINKNH